MCHQPASALRRAMVVIADAYREDGMDLEDSDVEVDNDNLQVQHPSPAVVKCKLSIDSIEEACLTGKQSRRRSSDSEKENVGGCDQADVQATSPSNLPQYAPVAS